MSDGTDEKTVLIDERSEGASCGGRKRRSPVFSAFGASPFIDSFSSF
jgi:hypothetical protein